MLARPERKMQMGLLAYIRRLFGGGDAEIRLMRLPQKLLTPPQIIRRSSPQSFCAALPGNSPPQRKEKTNRGEKNPKLTTSFQPFPPTCIQNQRPCPPEGWSVPECKKTYLHLPFPFPTEQNCAGWFTRAVLIILKPSQSLASEQLLRNPIFFLFFFSFVLSTLKLFMFYTGAGFC